MCVTCVCSRCMCVTGVHVTGLCMCVTGACVCVKQACELSRVVSVLNHLLNSRVGRVHFRGEEGERVRVGCTELSPGRCAEAQQSDCGRGQGVGR